MIALNELFTGDNIGGLSMIEIAHVNDVKEFPPLKFKPNCFWRGIDFHPISGLMKEEINETDNGMTYSYAGAFKIHNKKANIDSFLDRFLGQVSILKITDMNGFCQVIGSNNYPVQLIRSSDTGSSPTDMNHYNYSFSITQPKKALIV